MNTVWSFVFYVEANFYKKKLLEGHFSGIWTTISLLPRQKNPNKIKWIFLRWPKLYWLIAHLVCVELIPATFQINAFVTSENNWDNYEIIYKPYFSYFLVTSKCN